MGVSYEKEGDVFVIAARGAYPTDELKRCLDAVLRDPELPTDARLVLDVRASHSLLRRPVSDLRDVTAYFLGSAPRFGNRIALVVEGSARYGLMRMASAWLRIRDVEAEVFRTLEDAYRWLGDDPLPRVQSGGG